MPSIWGIRRSITTTSGRRRSASATAVSPSGASPTTRMCVERRSARRRPSRTTSWSSAIRTVISPFSSPLASSFSDTGLDSTIAGRRLPTGGPARAARRRLRTERRASRNPALAGQPARERPGLVGLARRQVRPPVVQALVRREQLGPVARERLEEVLAGAGTQVEHVRPDAARARRPRLPDDLGEELRVVGEPRQERCERDPRVDPRVGEDAHRLEPSARRRRAGLGGAPDPLVERRHRERDVHLRADGRLGEDVGVAPRHRPAGDQRERGAGAAELADAGAREPVARLGRLVRVGGSADRDALVLPGGASELASQDFGDVDLDADRTAVAVVRRPVGPGLERPDVTERAAVRAARVRVERPREGHPLDAVQRGAAGLLAVVDPHATG